MIGGAGLASAGRRRGQRAVPESGRTAQICGMANSPPTTRKAAAA